MFPRNVFVWTCAALFLMRALGDSPGKADELGEFLWGDPQAVFELDTLYGEEFRSTHRQGVRNPRILVAPDGSVLAFGAGHLRRSEDGGATWDTARRSFGNRQVVDEVRGDVLSVSLRENALWRSRDHGVTWEEEPITVLPNQAMRAAGDAAVLPGSVHFGGCESGITLAPIEQGAPYRLLMPARYQPYGSNDREYWADNFNTSVFSDDGGRTWQVSGFFPEGWTGEGTLAELADGRVYYNSRTHDPATHQRRMAHSDDRGATWTDLRVLENLYDGGGYDRGYGCNAGLVRLPIEGQDLLLFSTPDTRGGGRVRMTVWASFDGGRTWPIKRLVYEGPSAYSSLAVGRAGTPSEGVAFLLFEGGPDGRYSAMQLARFNLSWLLQGEPTGDGELPAEIAERVLPSILKN